MELIILRVLVLLCLLIIPLRGPSKRKRMVFKRHKQTITRSNYGINEDGDLEEFYNDNKK